MGVLLFHLVSMDWPVTGATMEEIAAAHVRGRRQRLADLRPDLPGRFVQVVERALERDLRVATAAVAGCSRIW